MAVNTIERDSERSRRRGSSRGHVPKLGRQARERFGKMSSQVAKHPVGPIDACRIAVRRILGISPQERLAGER